MDRISEATLRQVIAAVEREAITPPDDLAEPARAMFLAIAEGNKTRAWNAAHASALAHYCRAVVAWERGFLAVEAGTATPANLQILRSLEMTRLRLSKLLGLAVGTGDRLLSGRGKVEEAAREVGGALAASREGDGESLLS